jgi:hypothetical protein
MKKQSVPLFYEILKLQTDKGVVITKEDKELISKNLKHLDSKNNIQIITNFINQLCVNGLAEKKEKNVVSKKVGKTTITMNKKLFGKEGWLEEVTSEQLLLTIDFSNSKEVIYNPHLYNKKS